MGVSVIVDDQSFSRIPGRIVEKSLKLKSTSAISIDFYCKTNSPFN